MIATLQSLRFIFMMMIFMSHYAYRDIRAFDAGGDCGVAFFFLLSGFVCSLGYGRQVQEGTFNYGNFILRRIRRVYPLHLLCLFFYLLVSHSPFDMKVFLNLLLLQSWVPEADWYFSCNAVSWFLSSLLFCYLLFPCAYRYISNSLSLLILVACITTYWLTPYDRVNAILYVSPLVRFADFYLGMLLCRLYERNITIPGSGRAEVLLMIALVFTLVVYPYIDSKFRNAPLYWLVLIPLILVFAQQKGVISRWLKSKPMMFLGSITMPIFLTHQMLIGILLHRLPKMPAMLMLFVCIFVVLVISWGIQIIFYRLLRL